MEFSEITEYYTCHTKITRMIGVNNSYINFYIAYSNRNIFPVLSIITPSTQNELPKFRI